MALNIKHLLAASLVVAACAGTEASAQNWGKDADILNQLVNAGIISPQQANQIGSRGNGGWNGYGNGNLYFGPFGFSPSQPSHYDSNLINKSARQLDRLKGDRLISDYELNALKSQLTQRVKMVNENPGITVNGNFRNGFPNGYPNGYPNNYMHGASFNGADPAGGYRPRGMGNHHGVGMTQNWRHNY